MRDLSILLGRTSASLAVVSGLHRSGTTFVGEILKQAGTCVVHEPLNERFGMSGVPTAYPYAEKSSDAYVPLLDDAVHFARPWNKDVTHIRAKGWKRRLYSLTGGRSGLRWARLRFLHSIGLPTSKVCLKDPFMTLAMPYLVQVLGLKVVCLVRHPAAIHYSTEKQGWRFDIDNLRRQHELIERYGRDIPEAHWNLALEHASASIAMLWKMMMRINSTQFPGDERLRMVTHETLCVKPVETARQICSHFDVPFTPALEQFVIEHSGGDRVEAKDGKTHDFRRNSQAIPDAWRGRLNANDEAIMREIVGEEVARCYGQW